MRGFGTWARWGLDGALLVITLLACVLIWDRSRVNDSAAPSADPSTIQLVISQDGEILARFNGGSAAWSDLVASDFEPLRESGATATELRVDGGVPIEFVVAMHSQLKRHGARSIHVTVARGPRVGSGSNRDES